MLRFAIPLTVVSLACLLSPLDASAQDFNQELQQRLSSALANKHSDFKHDHRSNVREPITKRVIGKKGREFTGDASTGTPVITSKAEGEGLNTKFVYDCEIPWKGHWVLKNWHVTGYDKEEKNTEGKYKLKVKVHLVGGKIEYLAAESVTPLDHDSRKMPVEALEAAIFKNDDYLRKQLFP